MNSQRLLRPNPNFEEDLENHTIVGADIASRLKSYTSEAKKRAHVSVCRCQRVRHDAPTIQLNDGRHMPHLGFSAWHDFTTTPPGALRHAVEHAIDAGFRLIDTNPVYNYEEQVGQAIGNKIQAGVVKREDLFISTKLWNKAHARKAVVPALRESLARLGLQYVDLYLVSWPVSLREDDSPDDIDPLQTWLGMVECRDLGLARSIGLAHFNTAQVERLVALQPVCPAALYVELNLALQQTALLAYCRRLQIAVMACAPFRSVYRQPNVVSKRPSLCDDPRLRALAARLGRSVPQLVLRYLLELGAVALPSTFHRHQMDEDIQIFDFTLQPKDKRLLKSFDCGYRNIKNVQWAGYPYYPF